MPFQTRLDVALVQILLIAAAGVPFYYILMAMDQRSLAKLMRYAAILAGGAIAAAALYGAIVGVRDWLEAVSDKVNSVLFFIK